MKKPTNGKKIARPLVKRSSEGLANAMFDELDGIRNGTTTATNANAAARLADQICNIRHLELEVHKYLTGARGGRPVKGPGPIALGR